MKCLAGSRLILLAAGGLLFPLSGFATEAVWNATPVDNNWDNPANWTPQIAPIYPGDTATFGQSSIFSIIIPYGVDVGEIIFNPGASSYTFASGGGDWGEVLNNSGISQYFSTGGEIDFGQPGLAGNNVFYTVDGRYAAMNFYEGGAEGSTIVSQGASKVSFSQGTSAGKGTLVCSGGQIVFYDNASAGRATLISYAGDLVFDTHSDGGTARVVLNSPGGLIVSATKPATLHMTIGSLEGNGGVAISRPLEVGSNGLDTIYSGQITSGGRGTFTKIGKGMLTLTSAEPNLGPVFVSGGVLAVDNVSGSGTGKGLVSVTAGTLAGRGEISGGVTVGTGTGSGAFLAPASGSRPPATLMITKGLTFNLDGTFRCAVQTAKGQAGADEVVAKGVTIASGAQFVLVPQGNGTLAPGTVFTVLDNTATTPIAGTFGNLADGATVTAGANNFQASYEGGDGNDLTLTVVP
jgi:hypothetical protein